jgi:hypothetical protein
MPTNNPGLIFDNETPQEVLTITICDGRTTSLTGKQINSLIDDLAKIAVNNLPNLFPALKNAANTDKLKYNVLIANPLDNKVTCFSSNIVWTNNNDNAITHYFDFNFLFKWKSTYANTEDYLKGLLNSTPYSNVSVDFYGIALHNNEWRGNRLILEEKK